ARRGAGERTRVVLVAYADWPRANSLGPGPLLELAVEIGAAGVLLDTMAKDAGLFMLLDPTTVGEWVAAAHAAGRLAGLAGSLRGTDLATARALGADLVGARGAACVARRTGRVARGGDLRLLLHEHRARKPGGQGVGVLIHTEHGHPVGRVFADLHPPEHGANRFGERPAAGHDDEPTPRAEGCERLDDEIERA